MNIGGDAHLQYDNAFFEVGFNPSVCDHEVEELAAAYLESTFFRVEAHFVLA